jgi:putative membrane protein
LAKNKRKVMKREMMLIFSFFLFISFAAFAQEMNNTNDRNDSDKDDFVVIAASGSMMEIELGKLAQEKGESPEVKALGERMVRDHSKASDELKDIAQRNNIQLPDKMLDKHKEHVEELSGLSGAEFDEAYISLLAEDHEEDIELFEEASENYENRDVREWAKKTLPTLRDHKELVEELVEDLGDNSSY